MCDMQTYLFFCSLIKKQGESWLQSYEVTEATEEVIMLHLLCIMSLHKTSIETFHRVETLTSWWRCRKKSELHHIVSIYPLGTMNVERVNPSTMCFLRRCKSNCCNWNCRQSVIIPSGSSGGKKISVDDIFLYLHVLILDFKCFFKSNYT